jgi:hypothetical protein
MHQLLPRRHAALTCDVYLMTQIQWVRFLSLISSPIFCAVAGRRLLCMQGASSCATHAPLPALMLRAWRLCSYVVHAQCVTPGAFALPSCAARYTPRPANTLRAVQLSNVPAGWLANAPNAHSAPAA